jgi:hypothetical protein
VIASSSDLAALIEIAGLLCRVTRLWLLDRRETEFKPEWLEQTIEGFLGRIMAWIDRTQDVWTCDFCSRRKLFYANSPDNFSQGDLNRYALLNAARRNSRAKFGSRRSCAKPTFQSLLRLAMFSLPKVLPVMFCRGDIFGL